MTGQRVHVTHRSDHDGRILAEFDGVVCAFIISACMTVDGLMETSDRIIVQSDDGRFVFCHPGDVRVLSAVPA